MYNTFDCLSKICNLYHCFGYGSDLDPHWFGSPGSGFGSVFGKADPNPEPKLTNKPDFKPFKNYVCNYVVMVYEVLPT